MPRKLINAPGLYAGIPYSCAATVPAGGTFLDSRACPLDANGDQVRGDDLARQTRQALENLLVALPAAGCGPEDVLKTTVYVATTDGADLAIAWRR